MLYLAIPENSDFGEIEIWIYEIRICINLVEYVYTYIHTYTQLDCVSAKTINDR